MSLPSFSARRPVLTTMVALMICVIGAVSLWHTRIDLLPDLEMPTVTVRTRYDGASPEVMERLVTQIVEEIVATVPGVEEIESQSAEGVSNVRMTFGWGTDIDIAALDVRGKMEDELEELPENVDRPNIRKFDIASFPVMLLGITSRLDPVELTQTIEDRIRHRFSRIPEVAQVDLWGGYNREVRVELDPEKIKALEIPLDSILSALRRSNVDRPAGEIEEGRHEVVLRAPGEFQNLDEIRRTVIALRDGSSVALGQVANVIDTYEKLSRIIRVNGERGVRVAIRKQADANTVEVTRKVLREIDRINAEMPQLHIVPVIDQGNFIERSIANVARTVQYGGGLAVLVLLLFLASVRSTFIIGLAIPISLLATFALVYLGGFTINLMTLGGLALGVGMMVDSSIVVIENIYRRRRELKEGRLAAAVGGAGEVGPAIIASTITTIVVFLPLVFVRGVSGVLFQELAYVVVFSLICSLLVSLSLVPMLAANLLPESEPEEGGRPQGRWGKLAAGSQRSLEALTDGYRAVLRRVLAHRYTTILVTTLLVGGSFYLYPLIGTEFLPPSDEGEVRVSGEMEIGTRLGLVDRQTRMIEEVIAEEVPEAVSSVVSVGASGYRPNQASRGSVRLSLTPATQRERSNNDVADVLRDKLEGKIPGMKIRVRAPQGQFLLDRVLGGEEGLNVEVLGHRFDTLNAMALQAEKIIAEIPGVTDVETSLDPGVPQREIRIDRAKAASMGLSVADITDALEIAMAGARAGEYRAEGESYRIFVQLKDAEKLSIDEILGLPLRTASGQPVILRNVVDTQTGRGPMLIDRKDQRRVVKVHANIADRSLGEIAQDAYERLAQLPQPVGHEWVLAGNVEEQEKAFADLLISLLLAVMLVYMVLASQYESFTNPLIVMLTVPLAAIGVLVILYLTDTTLNIQSYIGSIMLGGIVVNNAILLVDQASQLQREGWSPHDAALEAGRRRLRPILMTTLTTILGLAPLALGIGEGADAQAPLARAVIGGLAGATPITLLFIPAVYSLVHEKLDRGEPKAVVES